MCKELLGHISAYVSIFLSGCNRKLNWFLFPFPATALLSSHNHKTCYQVLLFLSRKIKEKKRDEEEKRMKKKRKRRNFLECSSSVLAESKKK